MRVGRNEGDLFVSTADCLNLFTLGTVCSDVPDTQALPLFCLTDLILTKGKEKNKQNQQLDLVIVNQISQSNVVSYSTLEARQRNLPHLSRDPTLISVMHNEITMRHDVCGKAQVF